jgi:hypothetical protein
MRASYFVLPIFTVFLTGLILCAAGCKPRQISPSQSTTSPPLDLSEQMSLRASNKFSSLGTTTAEILSHENGTNQDRVIGALLWRLGQKSEQRGWDNLSDTERRLIAVDAMNEEVLDGGFHQYFSTDLGNDAQIALAGLKEMGSTNFAKIVERAMAQFPNGKPPTDSDQRDTVMAQIENTAKPAWQKCDSDYYDSKEDLEALELAYAKMKKAEIVLP